MKIIRTSALILVILLFANANSFSLTSLLSDKDIDTSNETIVGKQKLSKEDFFKLANEAIAYMKSPEFKNGIIKAIKEAAKKPKSFDLILGEAQQKMIGNKMLDIAQQYGLNSKEELDEAGKKYENDDDVKALNETMMNEILGVMIDIYSNKVLLKSLPKDIRKKLEDGRKMMESMIAPMPKED